MFKKIGLTCLLLIGLVACSATAEPTALPTLPTLPPPAEPTTTPVSTTEMAPAVETITPTTQATPETTPTAEIPPTMMPLLGSFGLGEGSYSGSGQVMIVPQADGSYMLETTAEFTVSNGPDMYVILSPLANPADGKQVGDYLNLGELQSTSGRQSYSIPARTDLSLYQSVVIYCLQYSVNMSVAPLTQP